MSNENCTNGKFTVDATNTCCCCNMRAVTPEFWALIMVGVVVVGSHWLLHRDIAALRERMARLEGGLESERRLLSERRSIKVSGKGGWR